MTYRLSRQFQYSLRFDKYQKTVFLIVVLSYNNAVWLHLNRAELFPFRLLLTVHNTYLAGPEKNCSLKVKFQITFFVVFC